MKLPPDAADWAARLTAAPHFALIIAEIDRQYWGEWKSTPTAERREQVHAELMAFARLCAFLKEAARGG